MSSCFSAGERATTADSISASVVIAVSVRRPPSRGKTCGRSFKCDGAADCRAGENRRWLPIPDRLQVDRGVRHRLKNGEDGQWHFRKRFAVGERSVWLGVPGSGRARPRGC